jgi:epoxide hydrolase
MDVVSVQSRSRDGAMSARYPKEVLRFPRPRVERHYNVTHWAVLPRGGHFAAMEQPALFVEDLRNFCRTVR